MLASAARAWPAARRLRGFPLPQLGTRSPTPPIAKRGGVWAARGAARLLLVTTQAPAHCFLTPTAGAPAANRRDPCTLPLAWRGRQLPRRFARARGRPGWRKQEMPPTEKWGPHRGAAIVADTFVCGTCMAPCSVDAAALPSGVRGERRRRENPVNLGLRSFPLAALESAP